MDFFNTSDFGFGDSPRTKQPKPTSKKSQTNKSVKGGGGDQFDDLLDELLVKQKKKQQKSAKQKQPQIHSLTSLVNINKNSSQAADNVNKYNPNTSSNINYKNDSFDFTNKFQPINKPSSKSIYDGQASQDNRSVRSGATAKASFAGGNVDNLEFLKVPADGTNNQWPSSGSFSRMMKPPLRKRNQSKMGSEIGQDQIGSLTKLQEPALNLNYQPQSASLMRPPLPRKQPLSSTLPGQLQRQSQTSLTKIQPIQQIPRTQPQIIQKQKIVYIKEQSKNLREQFDKQLKIIKQSHQRQISHIKQQLQKQVRNGKDMKLKLMKQMQEQRTKDKQLYQSLAKKDIEKLKQLYQWQIKRKSQAYQLQIQRLKKLSQLTLKSHKQNPGPSYLSIQSQKQQIRLKQKQLQLLNQKIQDRQNFLTQRQRALEAREYSFDKYRKQQQQKLQQQQKSLYTLTNNLQTKNLQTLKQTEQQKIQLSAQLANQQFLLSRKKQQLKIQKQQLQLMRFLFEKQKKQYEEFNANIMREYKKKLKDLEEEKLYCQNLEIQLYRKIQTVELMGDYKAGKIVVGGKGRNKGKGRDDQNRNRNNYVITAHEISKDQQQNIKNQDSNTLHQDQPSLSTNKKQPQKRNNLQPRNPNNNLSKNYESNNSLSPSNFQMQAQMEVQLQNLSRSRSGSISNEKQRGMNNNKTVENLRRSSLIGEKLQLRDYLLKTNRDNLRMRPHFV